MMLMTATQAQEIVEYQSPMVQSISSMLTSFDSIWSSTIGYVQYIVTYYTMWIGIQLYCTYFVKGKFSSYSGSMITDFCKTAGKAEIKKNFTGST